MVGWVRCAVWLRAGLVSFSSAWVKLNEVVVLVMVVGGLDFGYCRTLFFWVKLLVSFYRIKRLLSNTLRDEIEYIYIKKRLKILLYLLVGRGYQERTPRNLILQRPPKKATHPKIYLYPSILCGIYLRKGYWIGRHDDI